jgi:hypothetical protein
MEPKAVTTLSQRLRRFVRWFFTVSPEAAAELRPPLPPRRSSRKGRRHDSPRLRAQNGPRLRAQNAGRVHVSDRKRP